MTAEELQEARDYFIEKMTLEPPIVGVAIQTDGLLVLLEREVDGLPDTCRGIPVTYEVTGEAVAL